jgi:hypothetical protein
MAFISSLLLEHVKTHYLTLHYEVCGFVLPTSSGEVSIEIKGQGDPASSRPNCILPHYTNYIWHTHIYGSKSYPSAEDILKVMKKRKRDYQQIKAEIIFTPWGIWENSCSVFEYFSKSDILHTRKTYSILKHFVPNRQQYLLSLQQHCPFI